MAAHNEFAGILHGLMLECHCGITEVPLSKVEMSISEGTWLDIDWTCETCHNVNHVCIEPGPTIVKNRG